MHTIDNLLLTILDCQDPNLEQTINAKDAKVLRSIGVSVNSSVFITENQSRLLIKLLRENCNTLTNLVSEIGDSLSNPTWSRRFRYIDQVRKLYIEKNHDQESRLVVEFTFNSEIRKLMGSLNGKVENFDSSSNGRLWFADLTEKNIVLLVDALQPMNFEIDEMIKHHYGTIKSWSLDLVKEQFAISNIDNKNFQTAITADLGIATEIDKNIINDRSMRYCYHVDGKKNPGENLVEYLANRPTTRIWVDKNQHSLADVLAALLELKRLPLLVVFDNMTNDKLINNLEILSNAVKTHGLDDAVGVYFRLPGQDLGKKFNGLIAQNNYNHRLDMDLKVAALSSGKIPKFFLNSTWKPMSVLGLDTRMGLRHGKTSVYTNCCDLVIEYAEEKSILEIRKILWQ